MALIVTDAIVLHAFDYLETSRIFRLLTRDAGVQSVLARGARNSRKRFGGALDLFAEGQVQLQMKVGRELHTLAAFDAGPARPSLGTDLARFTASAALAECVLRVVHDESAPAVFDGIVQGLNQIAAAEPQNAAAAGLGALWSLVSVVGFAPTVDVCANCHADLSPFEDASFGHRSGGALCSNCAYSTPGSRRLPAGARAALRSWLSGESVSLGSEGERRAHQRLFREFLAQHLPDNRPMPAYAIWEQGNLGG
ncbi:MAG: DNA repair protein RecO [Gemmatimonadaceae bacterium]